MLDEEEFARVTSLRGTGMDGDLRQRQFGPILREYERITGFTRPTPTPFTTIASGCMSPCAHVKTTEDAPGAGVWKLHAASRELIQEHTCPAAASREVKRAYREFCLRRPLPFRGTRMARQLRYELEEQILHWLALALAPGLGSAQMPGTAGALWQPGGDIPGVGERTHGVWTAQRDGAQHRQRVSFEEAAGQHERLKKSGATLIPADDPR